MNPLELTAAALGLLNVGLLIARSNWNWPFGIATVCLYAVVFYEVKLYSDALLQVAFLGLQVYGWHAWLRARGTGPDLPLVRLGWGPFLTLCVGVAALGLAWGFLMQVATDAAAPYADAVILWASLAAQWLLARRAVESWILWIAVDLIAIPLFGGRALYATAILYSVFLVMATLGFVTWWQRERAQRAAAISRAQVF